MESHAGESLVRWATRSRHDRRHDDVEVQSEVIHPSRKQARIGNSNRGARDGCAVRGRCERAERRLSHQRGTRQGASFLRGRRAWFSAPACAARGGLVRTDPRWSETGINDCSRNPVCEGDAHHNGPTRPTLRRRIMKTLVTAPALALLIAPALNQSGEAAARKRDRDSCQSQQNENCYYRGYPLWQWYSS